MQGVATLDEKKRQARLIFDGSTGKGHITFAGVPDKVFGDRDRRQGDRRPTTAHSSPASTASSAAS
ncbi:hypothetical protein [Streptomyces broussonetiae]|nr:hypothetical protein [Streptomyces broussonetiae]